MARAASVYKQIKRIAHVSSSYLTLNTKSIWHENITLLRPTYKIYLKGRLIFLYFTDFGIFREI